MQIGATLINYLAEFYTAAEIRGFWKQAGDALTFDKALVESTQEKAAEGEAEDDEES